MVAEIAIASIVIRLLGLVQPFVFQTIIDRILPYQREASLIAVVVILALATLFSTGLDGLTSYLGNLMANRLTAELGNRIFRHVLNLPLRVLQDWQVGETISRIGEIEAIRGFLTSTVAGIVVDAMFAAVYTATLLSISPELTLIVLITLPLQVLVFCSVGPFVRSRMQDAFLAGSRHQSRIVEAFGNSDSLKAFAIEETHVQRFQETLEQSLLADSRVTSLNIVNRILIDLLSNTSIILIMFFGSRLVFQNIITLGELVAFHLLAEKVSGPIFSLSRIWDHWQELKVARLRLGDFLNVPAEIDTPKPKLSICGQPQMRVADLWFSYTTDLPVLRGITVDIDAGLPTIIVGQSGCGKSTFGKLLCGLYQPDHGVIEANGRNLAAYSPQSVRSSIVYHPQDTMLYSGSVLDNLLLINPQASEEQIQQALADSASDLFVHNLPQGLQTDVGERGCFLSGGQRQRIALARTFLAESQAIVLDEPTSALDDRSAAIVVSALQDIARRKTVIVITHYPALLGRDARLIDIGELQQDRAQGAHTYLAE